MDLFFPTHSSGNLKIDEVLDAFNDLNKTNTVINIHEDICDDDDDDDVIPVAVL